jgi:hypothetical protein
VGWLAECDSDGEIIGTWEKLPYMSAPKIKRTNNTAELRDGSDAVIFNDSRLSFYEVSTEILQADKKTQDLADMVEGKFFILIYKIGKIEQPSGLAKIQYHVYYGQIQSESEIDLSDFVKVAFTFKTIKNDKPIEIEPPTDDDMTLASTFTITIPLGKHRVIVEEAPTA